MDTVLPNLKFNIISGKAKDSQEIELHNKAFNFWKKNWGDIYKGRLNIDEFFRQDALSMIMDEDKIVALHLYTNFNLTLLSHLEHSYICEYSDKFKKKLLERKLTNVTSAEYMTVSKDYRGKGENIARILLYLSLNVFKFHGREVMIAPMDIKQGVSHIAQEAGTIIIDSNVLYKNFMVDLGMIIASEANHPPKSIEKTVNHLWNSRLDLSDWPLEQNINIKKAA